MSNFKMHEHDLALPADQMITSGGPPPGIGSGNDGIGSGSLIGSVPGSGSSGGSLTGYGSGGSREGSPGDGYGESGISGSDCGSRGPTDSLLCSKFIIAPPETS